MSMYKKVDTSLNFVEREKEIVEYWNEKKVFEKSMQATEGNEEFSFYDGPPTANGKPHIGHILTRVMKDIVPRYKTMKGKHVLILMASCTTGFTAKRAIEAITYYGGYVAGIAAVYRAVDEVEGYPVRSVYSVSDIPDYQSYDSRECPYCKQGVKLDALVNSYGYSAL